MFPGSTAIAELAAHTSIPSWESPAAFTSSIHGTLTYVTPKRGRTAKSALEFSQRDVKLFVLSVDRVEGHLAWSKDIRAYNGSEPTEKVPSPMVNEKNMSGCVRSNNNNNNKRDGKGTL